MAILLKTIKHTISDKMHDKNSHCNHQKYEIAEDENNCKEHKKHPAVVVRAVNRGHDIQLMN